MNPDLYESMSTQAQEDASSIHFSSFEPLDRETKQLIH